MAAARARADGLRAIRDELEAAVQALPAPNRFSAGLVGARVAVIAEVKRSSPSKGDINKSLDIAEQCRAYERGGAAAISVLTEPESFSGNVADLTTARSASSLPLLRKDFIVDEVQLLESRRAGASAVLLIARALERSHLQRLYARATELRMEALVEVRNEAELDDALFIGARIIGVNNRNLETLEMDDRAISIIPLIPRDRIAVAESGYSNAGQIARIASVGADAVLIGSQLSAHATPTVALRSLGVIPRTRNARAD